MSTKRKADGRRRTIVRKGVQSRSGIRDPAAAGLALVRAAAAILHHRGDLAQITPDWVEAYVRMNRDTANQEDL